MAGRIEDYGLIGNCSSCALVGRDGSIDWLCLPRFDSHACFAALLGEPGNGRWLIAPRAEDARAAHRYRDDTLILETRFETADGAASVVDFMPVGPASPNVVRLVAGERGRVPMRLELAMRFDYGASIPWVSRLAGQPGHAIRAVAGPDMLVLRSPVPLRGEGLKTIADFEVAAGERLAFVLSHGFSHEPPAGALDAHDALARTERFWRQWASRCSVHGPWAGAVRRSLITLKALTYAPTGGIVAAATTSLPETIGGIRNWDYRFCWLRDATLTLLAFLNAGYRDEAEDWRAWLERAVAGSPAQMQIMYGLAGERQLPEWELPWLVGYEGSKPVRVGNAAASQLQLDVYGELMDAMHQARKAGLSPDERAWPIQRALLEHLARVWHRPDHGLWEMRSEPRHFTHSKVMAWVAFDRAVKAVENHGLPGPVETWRALRRRIHDDVCRRGVDPQRGCFVQSYGGKALDASLLLLPQTGFLPATDPRIARTLECIERELLEHGLLLRYRRERRSASDADPLPGHEGAFLACSFWLADAYCLSGRHDEAQRLFERLLGTANDLGLLAEEYDPVAKRQLGNFPQAFSHVGLVNTALNLTRLRGPADQRGPSDSHARENGAAAAVRA